MRGVYPPFCTQEIGKFNTSVRPIVIFTICKIIGAWTSSFCFFSANGQSMLFGAENNFIAYVFFMYDGPLGPQFCSMASFTCILEVMIFCKIMLLLT